MPHPDKQTSVQIKQKISQFMLNQHKTVLLQIKVIER
jgi:hypothetical protein